MPGPTTMTPGSADLRTRTMELPGAEAFAAAPYALTPDVILHMMRRQLTEMDRQIRDLIGHIEDNRAQAERFGRQINELRELRAALDGSGYVNAEGRLSITELNDGDTASTIEALRRLGFTGTGTEEDDDWPTTFKTWLEDRFGIEFDGGELDISLIDSEIDRLTERQRVCNSGNEMAMAQLQSAMQQRTQVIQLGSNMLKAGDDALSTIIGNMGR